MLGEELRDPHGVEGAAHGLGVLPLTTEFQATKRYRHAGYTFGTLSGYWRALSGIAFDAYEIRHGHTRPSARPTVAGSAGGLAARGALQTALGDGCGWQYGETLAVYAHGMLESPAIMRALFGRETPTLDDSLNGLADFIDRHFDADLLMSWADGASEQARASRLGLPRG